MTKEVVSVRIDTPLTEAINLLLKYNFNGLPVTNAAGQLVGILTEYDLTIKGSAIHLPTLIKLLGEFKIYKKDKRLIKDDVEKIIKMKVGDAMNPEPLILNEGATIDEAIRAFGEHHRVNPIPIVGVDNKLVGILSRYDMIKLLGAPSVSFHGKSDQRQIDLNISRFLKDFEKNFVVVSGIRTRYWLIASILFALVGFFIAFAIILRIQ